MEKKVALLLAPGFEEAEAIVVVDILRRLKIRVDLLACQDEREVSSFHAIPIKADALLAEHAGELYDAVILPGGPQGARNLGASAQVVAFVKNHQDAGKLICPICSAGAHVLAANALLQGRRYTCSGDNHTLYADGQFVPEKIVRDGNVLSGRGLGVVFEFALAIGAELVGAELAEDKAEHIYFDHWRRAMGPLPA